MIVKIDRRLEKDVEKIRNKKITSSLTAVIKEMQNAAKLSDVQDVKKLKGTKNFYRIKIGDYRLGAVLNGNEVELISLLHRKDIYRYFP